MKDSRYINDDMVVKLNDQVPPDSKETRGGPFAEPNLSSYENIKVAYPPRAHHTQAPSLMLHVRYDGWGASDLHVHAGDIATKLYTLKLQLKRPNMVIKSVSSSATTGTVTFHSSNRVDITVNNSVIDLTSRGLLKKGYTWKSPALGNAKLTWKTKRLGDDLECVNAEGVTVALFETPILSLRKMGRLDLYGHMMAGHAVLEEILVTGLAMLEQGQGLVNVKAAG